MRAAVLGAIVLCACSTLPPTLFPPPFGPDENNPEAARFFFPTGIAISGPDAASSWVVVSNSNADRQYDAGAMYSLRGSAVLDLFARAPEPCLQPKAAACTVPFPATALVGTALTGNYTGPMVITPDATLYTGSRDTNRLNVLSLDAATGALGCRGAPGKDCRGGAIDLMNAAQVEGPFGVALANVHTPDLGNVDAVLVNSLVPHIDDIQSGVVLTSSRLAAVSQADLRVLFSATVTDRLNGSGFGGGPIVYDDRSREAIVAGCYTRFTAASAGGEASTIKCGTLASGTNLVRFVPVDSGSSAHTRIYDFGTQVHSVDTSGLALGDVDPVSGLRHLYMTTRLADTVVRIGLPADPAFAPVVEAVIPVSSQPSQILHLKRPVGTSGPELLAVTAVATYETSTTAGKLLIVDGLLGRVVGQVDALGDTPFAMAQFPPASGDASARLAITLFGGCSVALVDVPYDQPSGSTLRANIGSCPQ